MKRIFMIMIFLTVIVYGKDNDFKIKYSVIKTFPHNINLFTEGLFFHNGKLFESSGAPSALAKTRSILGILNLKTGEIEVKKELNKDKYFLEGIAYFKNKIYQLTYKAQTCFVYDSKNLKKTREFKYPNKEGWGLTTDGKYLIMSDGSSLLYYINPLNFKKVKTLKVTFKNEAIKNLNELEYIKGYIYANIWLTDLMVKINTKTGNIIGVINLSLLKKQALIKNPDSQETNGIAYDSKTDTIFVTGKMWPYVFQIKLNVK